MYPKMSVSDIAKRLAAHDEFLKTPQGKEWKRINDQTVDYLTLAPIEPPSEDFLKLQEKLKDMLKGRDFPKIIPTGLPLDLLPDGGFKRGELMALMPRVGSVEFPKSNLVFHMLLKAREKNPNLKVVIPLTFEQSEFSDKHFIDALNRMGLQHTPNQEGKQQ